MAAKKKATVKKATVKKAVAKKAAPKKAVAKKASTAKKAVVAKKVVVKAPSAVVKSVSKPYTKSQILAYVADQASATKKQATAFFNAITDLLSAHVKSKAGSFTLPGLLKATVVRKPATKARKGINPFTKEPTMFKAKPARNVVKIRALKALKDMVK
jgi:nucleoid DNA-binding protein